MKNASSVMTFERFVKFTGWGIFVSLFALFIPWLILVTEIRPMAISEKKYAADFYAIIQEKRGYAIYDGDAENLAKAFLSLSREQSSAFLVIIFEYLSDLGGNEKDPHEALLSARAKFAEANVENGYKQFSDNRQLIEKVGFKNLAANPEDLERIKKMLSGEKIPLYDINIKIPPLWRQMLPWFTVPQFLIGLSYFLFCWRNNLGAAKERGYRALGILEEGGFRNYVKRKWWRLPWKHGWPILALILLSPGALPLITGLGIITLGLKLKSRNQSSHAKKPDKLKPENFFKVPLDFGAAEREGQELLSRLRERVRR